MLKLYWVEQVKILLSSNGIGTILVRCVWKHADLRHVASHRSSKVAFLLCLPRLQSIMHHLFRWNVNFHVLRPFPFEISSPSSHNTREWLPARLVREHEVCKNNHATSFKYNNQASWIPNSSINHISTIVGYTTNSLINSGWPLAQNPHSGPSTFQHPPIYLSLSLMDPG